MKLETYLLQTLLLDVVKWQEIACPSISNQIRLCHIKSLFDGLQERKSGGDPLRHLPSRFRDPLLTYHEGVIRDLFHNAPPDEVQDVVETLRGVLMQDEFRKNDGPLHGK